MEWARGAAHRSPVGAVASLLGPSYPFWTHVGRSLPSATDPAVAGAGPTQCDRSLPTPGRNRPVRAAYAR
jgi:hypothetical protein